jgi:hypothetical protein
MKQDKLKTIKNFIYESVCNDLCVDESIDISTSNLDEESKQEIKKMFEQDIIDDLAEQTKQGNYLIQKLNEHLEIILNSRLFIYPEEKQTQTQTEFKEKLKSGNYTIDDLHEQFTNHLETPLSTKVKYWESNFDGGGLFAYTYDFIEVKNKIIYEVGDLLAHKLGKNEIKIGKYVKKLCKSIEKQTMEVDILNFIHLREYKVSPSEVNLLFDCLLRTKEELGNFKLELFLIWKLNSLKKSPNTILIKVKQKSEFDQNKYEFKYKSVFTQKYEFKMLDEAIDVLYDKVSKLNEQSNYTSK